MELAPRPHPAHTHTPAYTLSHCHTHSLTVTHTHTFPGAVRAGGALDGGQASEEEGQRLLILPSYFLHFPSKSAKTFYTSLVKMQRLSHFPSENANVV